MSAKSPRPFLHRVRAAIARTIAPTQARNGAFSGAASTRLTAEWVFAGRRSAAQDTYGDMMVLRNRARELVRNTPYASRFVALVAENIVGPHGIRLQAKNQTLEGKEFTRANSQIECAWEEWSRPEHCDAGGRHSFTELLALAVSQRAMDGEFLMREILGQGTFGYQLQLIDPDLLDETWNRPPTPDMNGVYQGVEVDQYFKPVAYWMWTRHPTDPAFDRRRVRIPASEIIHDFRAYRPGQVRGVSDFSPIMGHLKMLDGYFEAEVVAARIASASMAAIEQSPDAPAMDPMTGNNDLPMEVEPGAMLRLNPGEKLAMWDATHPTQAFADFTRTMLHSFAAGLGISYMTLTGDLSQANYSSMRAGLIGERDHWRREQQRLVMHVLDRIYRHWLKQALLTAKDQLPALDYDSRRWTTVQWQPRGFVSVDPMKEIEAALLEVNAGTKSLTQFAAESGRDLPDVIAERAREIQWFVDAGVPSNLATSMAQKESAPVTTDAAMSTADSTDSTASTDRTSNSSTGGRVLPLRSGTHG